MGEKSTNITSTGLRRAAACLASQVSGYTRPAILLMGSEREGLTEVQRAACETLIRLPMKGRVTSLNLAVATGVMLYAMLEKLEG